MRSDPLSFEFEGEPGEDVSLPPALSVLLKVPSWRRGTVLSFGLPLIRPKFRTIVGPGNSEMTSKFDFQEAFRRAIPRLARERVDRVIKSLSEKPQLGAESIHEARKTLKSLRALLQLARGSMDAEVRRRENIFFRDAGRLLSPLRDPQALLEALDYFSKGNDRSGVSIPKQESIRTFIEKIQAEIAQHLVNGLPQREVRKLLRELRLVRSRAALWFEGVPGENGNEWEIFVGIGLRRTYRKAKNLVWQFEVMGHERGDDNTWHELRKSAKALGYQLRLLKPIWPKMMNASVDEIDQLTDRLGDANDLAILRAKILNQPYDPSETQESAEIRRIFMQILDRRKQKLQSEAFKLAKLVYAEKPGRFEGRLAAYWRVGQGSTGEPKARGSGHNQEGRKRRIDQKTKTIALVSAPS
jgi:CHAD domain-containing protein